MVARAFGPEWMLSELEAEGLAEAFVNFADAWGWDAAVDPRVSSAGMLAITLAGIYLPRVSKVKQRKAKEKADAKATIAAG